MKKNVGYRDTRMRLAAGAALALLALITDAGYLRAGLAAAAVLMAVSAATGFCLLYRLAGKSSCPADHE